MLVDTLSSDSELPVVVTTGEPAGIGPELMLMLAAQGSLPAYTVAIGDPDMLRRAFSIRLTLTMCWRPWRWRWMPAKKGRRLPW